MYSLCTWLLRSLATVGLVPYYSTAEFGQPCSYCSGVSAEPSLCRLRASSCHMRCRAFMSMCQSAAAYSCSCFEFINTGFSSVARSQLHRLQRHATAREKPCNTRAAKGAAHFGSSSISKNSHSSSSTRATQSFRLQFADAIALLGVRGPRGDCCCCCSCCSPS